MIKRLQYLLLLLCWICLTNYSYAQLPYVESFKNSTAQGITFGGTPSAFLTAAGSSFDMNTSLPTGTPIDANGNGYLRLTSNQNNEKGYAISNALFPSANGLSVEFEYYIYGGTGADGISFFLFDAIAEPFNVGGFGGSLGYAQYTNTIPTSPGVSKGYLAIGLDEYGNFSNPIEGRQGGLDGLKPGSVTLRGKGDGNATVPENYPYLMSAKMLDFGFDLVGNGGVREPNQTSSGYRRVRMDMAPNPDGGYNITVKVTKGGSTALTVTVINYYYSETAPANLRYGFASSTGYQTNYHEIRNVKIDTYNGDGLVNPTAGNDLLIVCQGKQAIVDVLANDKTSNPGASLVKTTIDLDPVTTGIQNALAVAGKGTFTLTSDSQVQFIPDPSFTGEVTCPYVVKDTFGRTSNQAAITLTYILPPTQPAAGSDQFVNVGTPTATLTLNGSPTIGTEVGKWTQVSGPVGASISNSTQFNTAVTNLSGGIYIFRWSVKSSAGCELSDDVQVTINHRPIATDDAATTNLNTSVSIPVLANDTDTDGTGTINLNSIDIKTPPSQGTLVIDRVTGIVTYTPIKDYSGTDTFIYTVKDNLGVESNGATVTIMINTKPLGLDDQTDTFVNISIEVAVLNNDPGKSGVTVIKNSDPGNGVIIINSDGTIIYKPKDGFSGIDSFTYLLKNREGLESIPITVTINVRPTGINDEVSTHTNIPIVITAKNNDPGKLGTSIVFITNPLSGNVILNQDGNPVYTPNTGFSGKDTFSYILRTKDNLNSDPIIVNIKITPVIATPPDFSINTPVNTPLIIDVPIPPGSTVVIINPPQHGTITFDPVTGKPIYTPNPEYTGPDDFTYVIKDGEGNQSLPGKVNLDIFIPAKIGLAKNLKSGPVKNIDGTFTLTYQFTIVNYGEVAIEKLSLTDDLQAVFQGNTIKVNQITATGTLKANNAYNGTAVKELLADGSLLAKQSKEYVELEINVTLNKQEGTFNNTAYTEGLSTSGGSRTSDVSTDGLNPDPSTSGDVTPSIVTPVKILRQDLFIPQGFSPNNDGINDFFVLENTQGKVISLEVYNRWGNLIHRTKNYENNWAGKTTQGIHIGDDVPTGTYYYIIQIDGKDKRVGYITINR
jgi:gliding motility-associated-like protein